MSTDQRVKLFFKKGQVKLESIKHKSLLFSVGPTPQTVIRNKKGWSCSCEHFAIHSDERCSHIKAGKAWLKGEDLEEK